MLRSCKLGSSALLDASTLLLLLAAAAPTAIATSQRRTANQQATLLSLAATTPQHSSSLAHSLTSCASFIEETAAGIIRQQHRYLNVVLRVCLFLLWLLFIPPSPPDQPRELRSRHWRHCIKRITFSLGNIRFLALMFHPTAVSSPGLQFNPRFP